jgi:hypothetical protein
MKPKALLFTNSVLAAFVAALVGVLTATPGQAQPARTSVIAIQVNVESGGQQVRYGIRPNTETVPLLAGQRVKVSLVGTAIVNGVGVERPINARFHPASGAGALELGQSGPNWVLVSGRGNGVAQLSYDVTDRNYTMKNGFESGRITFQLTGTHGSGGAGGNGGNGGSGEPGPGPGQGSDRQAVAQKITERLYRAILNQTDLSDRRAQRDLDAIYNGGFPAIQSVARDLAGAAEARGSFDQRTADEVVGRFYRYLLLRNGSNRDIAAQDRGFSDNIRLLRERGLPELVRVIVGSQEFQKVQELERYGLLYAPTGHDRGHDGRDGRDGRDNRDSRDHDNRRPPR